MRNIYYIDYINYININCWGFFLLLGTKLLYTLCIYTIVNGGLLFPINLNDRYTIDAYEFRLSLQSRIAEPIYTFIKMHGVRRNSRTKSLTQ